MTVASIHDARKIIYDAVVNAWRADGQSDGRLFFENEIVFEGGMVKPPEGAAPWAYGKMVSLNSEVRSTAGEGGTRYATNARMTVTVYVAGNQQGMLELDNVCQVIRDAFLRVKRGVDMRSAVLKEAGSNGQFNIGVVEALFSYDEIILNQP